MSRYVAAMVYRKRAGSMARKAILAYLAERANDDGSGIWPSKPRVAREVECSKQTVIDTFKAFVAEGLLSEVGKRKTGRGYVVEYTLNIRAIEALPNALEDDELTGPDLDRSNQLTPRGQAAGPQGVKPVDPNRHLTVPEPSKREQGSLIPFERPKPKEDPVAMLREVLPEDLARELVAHRTAMKKPLTELAAKHMVRRLKTFPDPVASVTASIINGWQGVFAVEPKTDGQPPAPRLADSGLMRRVRRVYGLEQSKPGGQA